MVRIVPTFLGFDVYLDDELITTTTSRLAAQEEKRYLEALAVGGGVEVTEHAVPRTPKETA
jgi:hypothetical protein